jgi:class 3 adenylate cyclase
LVKVLNQYLALAAEAILAEEGTLDKFMGDGMMAFFNAPVAQPDHVLRAARAGLAIKQAIAQHNARAAGRPCLSFGIGIHLGQAVVGNIGTVERMDYTAVGDTVNLTKRLQENARGGQIIISQTAYNAIENSVTAEKLGLFNLKGRTKPVVGLELTGLKAN